MSPRVVPTRIARERIEGTTATRIVLCALLMLVLARPSFADAQLCGDADGSGGVTVTDGVGVLRHVAGLTSGCASAPTRCDLDGNGTVSVTDGVNVLRHVAGLSAPLACPGDTPGVARFAGRYQGTFSGDDEGDFDVDVDCGGDIEGSGYSSFFDEDFDIQGTVMQDGDATFVAGGGTSSQSTFRGRIGEDARVSGTWRNDFEGSNGSFRGSRTSQRNCP